MMRQQSQSYARSYFQGRSRIASCFVALLALGVLIIAVPQRARGGEAPVATVPGGYSAAGGLSAAGPYAGVLVYDVTEPAPAPGKAAAQGKAIATVKAKASSAKKNKAQAAKKANAQAAKKRQSAPVAPLAASPAVTAELAAPRRIVLLTREGTEWRQAPIATAERIEGPVCPKERTPGPVLAWTQRERGEWRLCVYHDGKAKAVTAAQQVLRNPVVALSGKGLVIGCESDEGGQPGISLYDEKGNMMLRVAGRRGKLAATPKGLLLLAERNTANAIWLEATDISDEKMQRTVAIRGPRDYVFNADLAVDPATGTAFIAAEDAVAFGEGCQLGLDRAIRVWSLAAGAPEARPWPDEDHGALPVEKRAFKTGMGGSAENTPPLRPVVLCAAGRPLVAFREFRCRDFKDFGWDVWCCRPDGRDWSAPARLTEQVGSPDTGYTLLPDGAGFVGVFPALDNPARSERSYAHRVELVALAADRALPAPPLLENQQGAAYRTPARFVDIAPEPPALKDGPAGLTLFWGDLHQHSTCSKCAAAANGMPDETIRYQRDVLGLQVISLLEHTMMMGLAEDVWTYDRLEAEAGEGRILLYGTEPGLKPGRHTNLYATARGDFDRLCSIFTAKGSNRAAAYRASLEAFPGGQVVALRHFHGDTAADDQLAAESFEPRLEVAMEAMQGRANNLLGEGSKAGFPSVYLNQGFKIGLVGGTDHYRETEARNHYCLTGFWVRERSAAGVWDALRNRRTLATSNGKIALWASVAGHTLGEDAEVSGPVKIKVSVASARPVRRVTLIRDGVVLPWMAVDATSATLELEDREPGPGRHWYVVTAEAGSAYPEAAIGHASPIFVTVKGR